MDSYCTSGKIYNQSRNSDYVWLQVHDECEIMVNQVARVRSLAGEIVLYSWARHLRVTEKIGCFVCRLNGPYQSIFLYF